jgi:hypothetical protein
VRWGLEAGGGGGGGGGNNCHPDGASCEDTETSYLCTCRAGWVDLAEELGVAAGVECSCGASNGNGSGNSKGNSNSNGNTNVDKLCPPLHRCLNVSSSAAAGGWWSFGCDPDECVGGADGNDCHADAVCTNVFGSFECECRAGFAGDGTAACVAIEGYTATATDSTTAVTVTSSTATATTTSTTATSTSTATRNVSTTVANELSDLNSKDTAASAFPQIYIVFIAVGGFTILLVMLCAICSVCTRKKEGDLALGRGGNGVPPYVSNGGGYAHQPTDAYGQQYSGGYNFQNNAFMLSHPHQYPQGLADNSSV